MNSYRISVHEAGHTVVGRALGMTCGDASIIRDPEEGEEGHSICADPYTVQWDWEQRGKFRLPRSVFVGRILTFMAGAEAERELLGVEPTGDSYDRGQVALMADAALSQHELETWDQWDLRARRHCRHLVRCHSGAIHKLAVALMRRGRMRTGEINELLAC